MSNRASFLPIFTAKQLTKRYRIGEIEVEALRGIDLELFDGEFIVFLGPSGSGKSTLLNILGGLDTATSGVVSYRDHDLFHATESELTQFRREHVGFVFQFYNLIPSLTALENVALVTDLSASATDREVMTPEEALALVGLENRANHFPSQLSGGEQQRVAIARAIAKKPDILLCDEPTGALDVATGKRVLEAIQVVHQQLGTLSVLITHNSAIASLAHRTIYLADGQIRSIVKNEERAEISEVTW